MNVLLGITGSVAAKLTPKLQRAILCKGHNVDTVVTKSALYFEPQRYELDDYNSGRTWMNYYSDETEWDAYKNENLVQHIELTKKADVFLIAPCTANTLAKIANGICDNLVTCCVRAFPLHKRLIIAPAMNTNMWENPITQKHVSMIRDQKYGSLIRELRACLIIDPISKELFCGDTGVGAMANIDDIVNSI